MMLCVVIKGPTFEEVHQQIAEAIPYADIVELRLDGFESLDLAALKSLRSNFSIPMIFTLRSKLQGGNYSGGKLNLRDGAVRKPLKLNDPIATQDHDRLSNIRSVAELKPEYLDIEHCDSPHFIKEIASLYPEIKLILSYHDFTKTPEDLEGIYREMQKIPAFFYKIAVTPHNCIDAIRFVCWAKKYGGKLIGISMGTYGEISRILGPVTGSPITYSTLEDHQKTAPGQLSAKMLIDRYRFRCLNPCTEIYGLIGDPVDGSISDETHNCLITACGLDAVYVKIQVSPLELSEFLHFAKQLPFRGISVTMPLKEHILPILDCLDPQATDIGAVNTLLFEDGKIFGFNTDGVGALNAIERECPVKDKKVVIIGAGGAAKAIAFEAVRRGGCVTILNRTAEKAIQIAQSFQCDGKGLDYMTVCAEAGYDVLINCTPDSLPIPSEYILSQAVVMDIKTKPKDTEFLRQAKKKGCRIVYGYHMFVEQALCQFNIWFKDRIDMKNCREILEKKASEAVKN